MSNTGFDSDSENILFFGDPNLGEEGYRLFSSFFLQRATVDLEKRH